MSCDTQFVFKSAHNQSPRPISSMSRKDISHLLVANTVQHGKDAPVYKYWKIMRKQHSFQLVGIYIQRGRTTFSSLRYIKNQTMMMIY